MGSPEKKGYIFVTISCDQDQHLQCPKVYYTKNVQHRARHTECIIVLENSRGGQINEDELESIISKYDVSTLLVYFRHHIQIWR